MSSLSVPAWMRAEYPFDPYAFKTASGAQLSYLDEGPRGETAVLMLHGNPTWSYYFRDLVRELCGGVRCLAPDHIGMGLSEKPANYTYTLETRIADVEALILHLGVKRIRLVVHDWGGAIGFGLATRHPEWIERIVILNTAAFRSERIPLRISVCRWPGLGALLVRGLNGFAGPATHLAMHRRALTPEQKRAYLFPYDSWNNRIAVHQFVRDIPMSEEHPSYPTLVRIEERLHLLAAFPKLIVWGGRDFCFNDSFLARWREIYPEAKCLRLPEAGHYILEDGGEEARRPVIDFLK
jgi:cis-3-alkyl-4-acyloxetan-2-one decarboxylase